MNYDTHINRLLNPLDNAGAIDAARMLADSTNNSRVMDALCAAAVCTDSHKLRDVLIDVLKTNRAGACIRFSDDALWSKNPMVRKWALVNLSLLRCRDAKNAVISGLYDVDADVRKAAALNTGLYDDTDVQDALERYFENHRLDLTLSLIAGGLNGTRNNGRHPEEDDVSITTVLI